MVNNNKIKNNTLIFDTLYFFLCKTKRLTFTILPFFFYLMTLEFIWIQQELINYIELVEAAKEDVKTSLNTVNQHHQIIQDQTINKIEREQRLTDFKSSLILGIGYVVGFLLVYTVYNATDPASLFYVSFVQKEILRLSFSKPKLKDDDSISSDISFISNIDDSDSADFDVDNVDKGKNSFFNNVTNTIYNLMSKE